MASINHVTLLELERLIPFLFIVLNTLWGLTMDSLSEHTEAARARAAAIAKGQEFESFDQFKSAVYEWAVAGSFVVRVSKSDKARVAFACHNVDCIFRIAAWWHSAVGKVGQISVFLVLPETVLIWK